MILTHFQVGQPVRVASNSRFAGDWRGVDLWIVAARLQVNAIGVHGACVWPARLDEAIIYDVAEHWPPLHLGDITTDFWGRDLEVRPVVEEPIACSPPSHGVFRSNRPETYTPHGVENVQSRGMPDHWGERCAELDAGWDTDRPIPDGLGG